MVLLPSYDGVAEQAYDGAMDICGNEFFPSMYEVVFKIAYDNFYFDLSRRFPSFKKYFWCNYNNDIIEIIVDNPEEYRLVVEELNARRPNGIIEESSDQQKVYVIVKSCSCEDENPVEKHVSSVNMLHIFPSILERGWEYNRILFFRHEDFEELMQRFKESGCSVEILRKVPFDGYLSGSLAFTADALLSDLTDKQVDALLTAHRYGYYSLPRRADVQTIASRIQVPRTTFQEHLKKAENKLMAALAPYVQLFKHSSSNQKRRLKIDTRNPPL